MDSSLCKYPNFNDQTIALDMLNEYQTSVTFDDTSFLASNPNSSAAVSSSFSLIENNGEVSDNVINHINQLLMEEDDINPKYPDPLALQAKEEFLYEAIGANVDENVYDEKQSFNLLVSCAEAVAADDRGTASELLLQIRQHSSLIGDHSQRLAHWFANALEARLAGIGAQLYTSWSHTTFSTEAMSGADISKFYRAYFAVCPFMKMVMIFANQMILKVSVKADTLHIIDFCIRQGLQWPALIHCLSKRPGGPPKLRITGIELPLSGSQSQETVQETGRRLASYCKRFNVPFEYNVIAGKWGSLQLDDFNVQRNEVLAVHCLCRFEYVLDETVSANNPRDAVLILIRKLNPDIFVHSILNASHVAPSFVPRFRDALLHFSSFLNLFDTTLPRDDEMRLGFEKEFVGREVLNVVACEGSDRIARPETYKQWRIRNMRAGFTHMPLDYEVVNKIKEKVKGEYHKCFVVDEDGNWLLQGWKGRMMIGAACWIPNRT